MGLKVIEFKKNHTMMNQLNFWYSILLLNQHFLFFNPIKFKSLWKSFCILTDGGRFHKPGLTVVPNRWTNKVEEAEINAVFVVIIADTWGATGNNGDGDSTNFLLLSTTAPRKRMQINHIKKGNNEGWCS